VFSVGAIGLVLAAALGVVASTIVGTSYQAIVGLGVILVAGYGLEIKPVPRTSASPWRGEREEIRYRDGSIRRIDAPILIYLFQRGHCA
jgi:hypothetical protein